jgi:hypothetical protein
MIEREQEKTAEMRSDPDFAPLVDGLDNLKELVSTVRALHRRTLALGIIVVVLVGILVAVFFLGHKMREVAQDNRDLAEDAKDQSERLQEVVANQRDVIKAQNRERMLSSIEACQVRNAANQSTRQQFRLTYQVIRRSSDSPEGKAFVEVLIDRIPDPQVQDRDCNDDGVLSRRDYLR